MNLIFCYGTLKKGHLRANNLAEQKYLGEVKTLPKYKLYNLGDFPGLVCEERGSSIEGELYEVTDNCLELLDYIEGHPDLFKREIIEIAGHTGVMAYLWQGEPGMDCGVCWT